ncbi:MAG TPA: SAM-dependent methyltransferase [Trebonia sp.]
MANGPEGDDLPTGVDLSRPHTARMYDYLLGGKDHFAVDRETMDVGLRSWPGARAYARENRKFLARAVEYLAREAGIRQFLDIGTGLPSANNVHEIAQRVAPDSRVVYVDNDPLVLAHARALLTSDPAGRTAYIHADLRDPEKILAHPVVRDTLDFSQPIALMLVAILHFIRDEEDPGGIVATLMSALAPGSYLVSSHVTAELDPEGIHGMERAYRVGGLWAGARSAADFGSLFFTGLELVDPGLVLITDWRGTNAELRPLPSEVSSNGAVGRKPALP